MTDTGRLPALPLGSWRPAGDCLWWEASLGPARLIMSTRHGGASAPPYDTLNLGLHVGDSADTVIRNRHHFWAAAGPQRPDNTAAAPLECAGAPAGGRSTPLSVRWLDAAASHQAEQSPGSPTASPTPANPPFPVLAEQVH